MCVCVCVFSGAAAGELLNLVIGHSVSLSVTGLSVTSQSPISHQ